MPRDLRVELSKFTVGVSRDKIDAGDVNLIVEHDGSSHAHDGSQPGVHHDLVVLRMNDDGTAEPVARTRQLLAGESEDLTLQLAPGRYDLVCDVVETVQGETVSHLAEGMHRTFIVSPAS